MSEPKQPSLAAKRFSLTRIAWTFCLLGCTGVVVHAALAGRAHRDWWNALQSEQIQYAQWDAAALREADAIVGDIEGLSREQAVERLTSRVGPDDPYPMPPLPLGVARMAMAPDPIMDSKVEPPLYWNVRSKNWCLVVPVYDGQAQRLTVTMLKRASLASRAPRSDLMLLINVMIAIDGTVILTAIVAAAAWWLRWNHRAVVHACLMSAVLGWAVVLATDWEWRIGPNWGPLAMGGPWKHAPWEGPALGLLFALLALRAPSRRPKPGVCAECGYDLTGNVSGVCPECGITLPPAPPVASAALAATR